MLAAVGLVFELRAPHPVLAPHGVEQVAAEVALLDGHRLVLCDTLPVRVERGAQDLVVGLEGLERGLAVDARQRVVEDRLRLHVEAADPVCVPQVAPAEPHEPVPDLLVGLVRLLDPVAALDELVLDAQVLEHLLSDSIRIRPENPFICGSSNFDTFQDGLLAPPVYTRPAEYKGMTVPDVLLSGNFGKIEEWRENKAYERTEKLRPDLLE